MTTTAENKDAVSLLEDDLDFYASYIREITDDGEAIVDCLISIMEDESVDAKPYERLDAQLLLDSIGYGRIALDHASSQQLPTPTPQTKAPTPPTAGPAQGTHHSRRPAVILSEDTLFSLPPLVRDRTDRGRKMADFLLKAVTGEFSDFMPHHMLRAVKQLAPRGFAKNREPQPDNITLSVNKTRKLISSLISTMEHRTQRAADTDSAQQQTAATDGNSEPAETAAPAAFIPIMSTPDEDYLHPCSEPGHIFGCPCADYKDDELTLKMQRLEDQLDVIWDNYPDRPP